MKRLKRGFFDFWATPSTEKPEELTVDQTEKEDILNGGDDDAENDLGSGFPDRGDAETEPREKTLRVTFVVHQPYQAAYNKRDSYQFKSFSKSLADAVNQLYEKLPGTQRASLVRIQSRLANEFTCKVTLDIVTTGYDDTDRIADILQKHIRNTRALGELAVNDTDFSAILIDPGSSLAVCAADEMTCDDGGCRDSSARCNGVQDCNDGSDEAGCPTDIPGPWGQETETATDFNQGQEQAPWPESDNNVENEPERGDGNPFDVSTPAYPDDTTPYNSNPPTCRNDELRCDETRCVALSVRCDGRRDCDDGQDEQNCEEICNPDDFRCSDGKCIEGFRQCDRLTDCPYGEDEQDCPCTSNEFTCPSDGACIELRKVCDGTPNCADQTDEQNCQDTSCPADSIPCARGSSVRCGRRCDGRMECIDGEDENNCEECNHECDGRCLRDDQICNGVSDCRDGSDEIQCDNCDGPQDFRCRSGECININQRCNGVAECPDYSDELNCNDTVTPAPTCRSDEFPCVNGQCIAATEYCDGIPQCTDGSDEQGCPTTRPWFTTTTPYPPYEPPYQPQPPYRPPPPSRPKYTTSFPPSYPRPQEPSSPVALLLRTYPEDQSVRNGGDVVFQCRDEGPKRAPVRWVREGGRPIKAGSIDKNGRLEMIRVSPADSGTYICQAPAYLGYPGAELRVHLTVDTSVTQAPARGPQACQAYQATCGNGECISKSAICDGVRDCSDGSDEESCNLNGLCEPNQFQCANRKCVLKTWLCDNENDCGDNSDEANCGPPVARPGDCLPVEFKCQSGAQCVPKSFHCDGQTDCLDGSDEIGCLPVHVTKPATPANLKLNPGETLILRCEAVGVPTPLISWRLNWGHVPQNCTSTSVGGVGVLTCHNMQPEHSGAYSCEAINNKGTVFAAPDSIVQVDRSDVCPPGYFNSEARSERECIRCFCFGESTQCHSADLFTYNMPTPLGEGGTRLVGVKMAYNGQVQIDSAPITDNYYYQALRNGATITKIENFGNNRYSGGAHPYLTLPETYNGNQLTSYGGYIRYQLAPHSPLYSQDDGLPDIIIKGKYGTLVHRHRGDKTRNAFVEARLTPEHWQQNGQSPATREDIMMALDNIEMILLRADLNNAGVNITDFAMESAQHINVGLGAASLVEECTCPPGYEGLSCQKCASGYTREKSGPWLGNCVTEQRPCPLGTYGDPRSGYACKPCPCPLTSPGNNFARGCSVGPGGRVICDCAPGYGGETCEYCEPGYVGNPMVPGDSCKPAPSSNCNPIGTQTELPFDECQCKENVQGRYCDQCKDNAYFLSEDNRHGCASCFCSGVTSSCRSSNLRRKTTTARFNTPQIVQQVKVYQSASLGLAGNVKYNAPVESQLRPSLVRGMIALEGLDRSRPSIYYWSLPASFAGDKVTSYGGYLTYTLSNVPPSSGPNSRNNAADVQLISENRLTFHYFGNFQPTSDGMLNASVQFIEKGWQRADGKEVSREHFLLALADVKAILVKATYSSYAELASIESASIDTAEPNGNGPPALHVEQCVCPVGYVGTSCEDCAPGYTRNSSGLYLEQCAPCDCGGHSSTCHPETGVCYNCRDNTDGENCELCKPGYEKSRYSDVCEPSYNIPPSNDCSRCDPSGSTGECDSRGICQCKQNVEGEYCDVCRPGTFGLDRDEPLGCLTCYCSGVTNDCHEAGHFSRMEIPSPVFGPYYGGYTITNLNGDLVINDQFVPDPNESELMYTFSFPPSEPLYWSLPGLPGNRVMSYGGSLSLLQKFETGGYEQESTPGVDVVLVGDTVSVYWTNPTKLQNGVGLRYNVPIREGSWYILNTATPASRNDIMGVLKDLKRVLVRADVTPNLLSTSIADVSMDTAIESSDPQLQAAKGVEICVCPEGYSGTSCETCAPHYYRDQYDQCRQCPCNGHDCSLGARGDVICNCRAPYSGRDCSTVDGHSSVDSSTTYRPPPPESTVIVRITSPTIKIEEIGGSVNFTCQARSQLTTTRLPVSWIKDGGDLPQGRSQVDSRSGLLLITNLQISDSGTYICQTSDGVNTAQAFATLKVPGNEMTLPSVAVRPESSNYNVGDRIELECLTTGNPMPRITWQRAGSYALPRSINPQDTRLIIESALESDSGEYRCIATNTAGSVDRTAVISVRPPISQGPQDKLTVSSPSSTIKEGQTTRIVCTGTQNIPAGAIDWIREDNEAFRFNVRSDQGVLYIENAVPENRGIYICQASSPGITPVPVLLTVIPLGPVPPSQQPNITIPEDRITISTGDSKAVECIPLGYPQPRIRWSKHDGQFSSSVSQRDNSLIISNAQESDDGYYVCEGIVDDNPIGISYVYVTVTKRVQPKVDIWPQGEQAVTLGSQFEMHCRVLDGVPEPDITWSRSGGRPLSPHVHILKHNVLRFENIEVNDEGEYQCVARNEAGTSSASAVLKVRSTPEITITPNNYIQANTGDPINVECRASGYPEPMVSISSSDGRVVVPQTPGIAVLRISSASDRDEGDYLCSASNAAGRMEDQFAIRVVARGDIGLGFDEGSGEEPYPSPEQPASLIAVEGEERIIDCDASAGFEVQWRRVDGRPLQPRAFQSGSSLVIRNASKSDSGRYECTLINRYTNEPQQAAFTDLQVVSPPRITLQPKTQTVHPGESPTVECIVTGDNINNVTWEGYQRRPLPSRVETRRSMLIFHQIEVQDAGKYECFASNSYATASAVAEVIVSGGECSELQYLCDDGTCIDAALVCDGKRDCSDDEEFCYRGKREEENDAGPPVEAPSLISIDQPRRSFRVGENVEVLCRASSRGVSVTWERYNPEQQRQFVETRTYGDGAMLLISGVQEADAGVYRCTGRDYSHTSFEDFDLEVIPASFGPSWPLDDETRQYTARLGQSIDMPCEHNLEPPFSYEWRREYTPLPPEVNRESENIHLESVTEADAGTYVCRVTNPNRAIEARAILRVEGVVPRFEGYGWLSLPTIKDAYRKLDVEVSFKPTDYNGLILYNDGMTQGVLDYVGLRLVNGTPELVFDASGEGRPTIVRGDRPLQLNTWHTVRVSRINDKVSMDVDNTGPFTGEIPAWELLELNRPLYIGGVPDRSVLPAALDGTPGFAGCVSMLIVGREEKNIMMDNIEKQYIEQCDACTPNLCYNNGVCQEARNERGYMCLCAAGYSGLNCDRTGEACRPGLCGPGKCADTDDGYKCACPISYSGRNCQERQQIEYPAFTGSAYLAIKAPHATRYFQMSMKVKASSPVTDGIIMYCAESPRGYGAFTSLGVRDGRLEFRYDMGDGSTPFVLVTNNTLPANDWTTIHVMIAASTVSLKINTKDVYEVTLRTPLREMRLETPMFVGGVDDSIVLNNNTGVSGGFNGCIKDVTVYNQKVDIVNSSIQSANVQECSNYIPDRGDIPEEPSQCPQCRNGGSCPYGSTTCVCPPGYTGELCESRAPLNSWGHNSGYEADPCAVRPCRNNGVCHVDRKSRTGYSCDCPLGFAGYTCHIPMALFNEVGFNGNGYLELPSEKLRYDRIEVEPVVIALAFHTNQDGVLLYQREAVSAPNYGDYILLRIEQGHVVLEWNLGSGSSTLVIEDIAVNDGERHEVIVQIDSDFSVWLKVDQSSQKTGVASGLANLMNADSNIYIGGIPDSYNVQRFPGLTGCIEQVELMDTGRNLHLGDTAVAGWNAQRCRDFRH